MATRLVAVVRRRLTQTAVSFPLVTALEKNSNTFPGANYAKNVFLRFDCGGFVVDGSDAKCAGSVAVAIRDTESRSWRAVHTVALHRCRCDRFRRGRTRHLQRLG